MKSAWIAFRVGVFRGRDAIAERKGKQDDVGIYWIL
jgi:hypothetical protein